MLSYLRSFFGENTNISTVNGPVIQQTVNGRWLLTNNGKTYARKRDAVRGYSRLIAA